MSSRASTPAPAVAGVLAAVSGVRLHPLGATTAAYSPLSGDTHLLNDTCVAVLELLAERGPSRADVVVALLTIETETPKAEVSAHVDTALELLRQAGLVVEVPACSSGRT